MLVWVLARRAWARAQEWVLVLVRVLAKRVWARAQEWAPVLVWVLAKRVWARVLVRGAPVRQMPGLVRQQE